MILNTIQNWIKTKRSDQNEQGCLPRVGRSGMALISAVFVTLFVSSLTVSLAALLANSSSGSVEDLQSQQSAYLADSGLHYILMKEFRNSTDFTTAATATNIS